MAGKVRHSPAADAGTTTILLNPVVQFDPAAPLGEGQIRRARKALTDLTILMLDNKDAAGGQRIRSFGRVSNGGKNAVEGTLQGRGHHRRRSSGSGLGFGSGGSHFRSLSWSVSRSWFASRQLQTIGGNLPVPRANDVAATSGLASAVYTMGVVLFINAWALVAAIPCKDHDLHGHFAVPRSFPWASPVTTLYERVLEESKKKDRKHSCGLLKEIHLIERWPRQLMEITDAAQFPLDDKDAEVREAAQELVQVCETLKDRLDPLKRQVREMFHRIVLTRTEILEQAQHRYFERKIVILWLLIALEWVAGFLGRILFLPLLLTPLLSRAWCAAAATIILMSTRYSS